MKIIQIAGLGHSGTTIIDRILACHPRVAGMGETGKVFAKRDRRGFQTGACSCQRAIRHCPIWGPVLARPHANLDAFYEALIVAAGAHGYDTLSDSSKDWGQVTAYHKLASKGLVDRVVLLRNVRDPRGWVQSAMRSLEIAPDDRDSIRMLFFRWLLLSLKMDLRVSNATSGCAYIWYDRLVLDQAEPALAGLLDLAPLPEAGIDLTASTQHAITGNQFLKTDKRNRISYDASWLGQRTIEDVYGEVAMVRDYYHLVQGLHLTRDRRLSSPPILDHRSLVAAAEKAGSAAPIEEALAGLNIGRLAPAPRDADDRPVPAPLADADTHETS